MNTNPNNPMRTNGSNGTSGANSFSGEVVVHLPGMKDKDAAETDFSATQATKPVSTSEDKEAARDSTKDDPVQKQLKTKAEWLRNRLSLTLESLAQRKQDAVDITHQVKEHPLPFAIAGGTLIALFGGMTLLAARKPKLPPTLGERLRAVGEAWMYPGHVSKSHAKSSKAGVSDGSSFAGKAALSLLSLVAAEALKFGIAKLNEKSDVHHPQPL